MLPMLILAEGELAQNPVNISFALGSKRLQRAFLGREREKSGQRDKFLEAF